MLKITSLLYIKRSKFADIADFDLFFKRIIFLGRTAASQNPRMATKGSSAPAPSNVDLTEYLDPSTLQQLQNLQVISPNQSAAREQPKGTDFLEIANRVSYFHIFIHIEIFSLYSNSVEEP